MVQNESVLKKTHTQNTARAPAQGTRVRTRTHPQEGKEFRDGEGKAIEINMISKNIMQSGGDRIMT